MNVLLLKHELTLILLGVGVLLADLWLPAERKRNLGCLAAAGVGAILICSFLTPLPAEPQFAFGRMFVLDGMALFFKRFFLVATILVLLMAAEYSDRIAAGISEYYSLILFAAAGMMFAASANDFALLFVALELITVTFYVLVSFQRGRSTSLEAGVKYLIIGALSSAFMVFGIAFMYGTSGAFNFGDIAAKLAEPGANLAGNKLFLCGLLFLFVGLGFKISAVPFQIWAPDVYQGAPTPTTAFLAVGSKAAGFVLLLRVLFVAVPDVTAHWWKLLVVISALTILYGNLCALPQTNLKRLLGYSSISHAGYLLLGVAAASAAGQSAVLYYLGGYLFTVLAAFLVIALVLRETGAEDIEALAGLNQRSPLLAAALTFSMVSLAGIPPLAGFFGKFLLIKSALLAGAAHPAFYWLVAVALAGVVMSLAYYFGVVRAIYWGRAGRNLSELPMSLPAKTMVLVCMAGILFIGIYPSPLLRAAEAAVLALKG
ncbi:MAG TPA: NADH-quinone oxidoreductase subunit N [Verrucomicrobiae bacterium]|nr:NADH-quinone oxidoreductase subunit N [Verrucomicrobiae bacterium]